jgi:DNA-binding GntR family transcriptional regulator
MCPRQLEPKTLSNMAYEALKESILKNEMLPGQEVVIRTVAASLGVSHIPVREAVARLAADGFVEQSPHRTLRVAELNEDIVRQAYEVRRLLEPHAAVCAARQAKANPAFRKPLQDLLESAEGHIGTKSEQFTFEESIGIDLSLNEIFLKAVDNDILREILTLIGNRSLRTRTYTEATNFSTSMEANDTSTREHIAIIRAIIDGDDEAHIREVVIEHLKNGEGRTRAAIRSRGTA